MKYTIPVITRLQDNGDGGWSLYAYNTEDELIADHPLSEDGDIVNGKWVKKTVILTPEQRKDILTEDDPHENGYIGSSKIEVEIDENGVAHIISPLSFHCGQ